MSIMSKEETQAAYASNCPHRNVSKSFVRAIEAVVRENFKRPNEGLPALLDAYVVLLAKHTKPGHFQSVLENATELLSGFTGVGDGADLPDEAKPEASESASEVPTTGDIELDKLCELISVVALVKSGGDKDKAFAVIDEMVGKICTEEHAD